MDSLPADCFTHIMKLVFETCAADARSARAVCTAWRDAVTHGAMTVFHADYALRFSVDDKGGHRQSLLLSKAGAGASRITLFDDTVRVEVELAAIEMSGNPKATSALMPALRGLFDIRMSGRKAGRGRSTPKQSEQHAAFGLLRGTVTSVHVFAGSRDAVRRRLRHLRGLPAELHLMTQTKFSDVLHNIDDLASLLSLSYVRANICGADLLHMARLTALTSLDIDNNPIGEAGAAHLAAMPHASRLARLHVSNCLLDNAALRHICDGLRGLRDLNISYNDIDDAGMLCLRNLPRLEVLDAGILFHGPRAREALQACTSLQRLNISFADAMGLGHAARDRAFCIPSVAGLLRLDVSNANITDDLLAPVAGLRYLEHLDLSANHLTSLGMEHLRGASALRFLYLCWNHVCDVGAGTIAAHLRGLLRLEIDSNDLGDAGVAALLAGLPALRYLDARRNKTGVDADRALRRQTRVAFPPLGRYDFDFAAEATALTVALPSSGY